MQFNYQRCEAKAGRHRQFANGYRARAMMHTTPPTDKDGITKTAREAPPLQRGVI